ncbi:MAG: DUF6370 family protein [Candidatus Binatia bacterium]
MATVIHFALKPLPFPPNSAQSLTQRGFGDAHASDGLCNASTNAVVEGRIDGDRFVATHFALKSGER